MQNHKVYLVGAGPGRADLITIRARDLIARADCIICDRLASPELLKLARRDAEILHVPKRLGDRPYTQQQVNKLIVEKAAQHNTVVRLKGGDPCLFARVAEELDTLADAGIDFEIVPGVTAASAAAAFTGILLTDRTLSSQVVFLTGREADGKTESGIDFQWLAKFSGTIVIYMGVGTLQHLAERLIENGAAPQTPVAVVANATLPAQKLVRATLTRIAAECRQQAVEAPAVIIIGPAAEADPRFNWLAASPLFGKTIVVTRDQDGNTEFAKEIAARGGSPVEFATIRIEPLTDKNPFLHALAQFPDYDWIIFTSKNGVRVFFDVLNELGKDVRVFASAKVAAIGPQTANALTLLGLKPDFVPEVFTGRELAGQLARFTNITGKRILLLRSRNASDDLPQLLRRAQAVVDDIAIYETIPVSSGSEKLKEDINAGRLHWLTFASPSSADSFFQQLRPEWVNSSKAKVASIGPVTSDRLRMLGVNIDVEAAQHNIQGLIKVMETHRV